MNGQYAYSLHEGGLTVIRGINLVRSVAMNQGAQSVRTSQNLGMGHTSQALFLFIFLLLVFEAAQSGKGGLIPGLCSQAGRHPSSSLTGTALNATIPRSPIHLNTKLVSDVKMGLSSLGSLTPFPIPLSTLALAQN